MHKVWVQNVNNLGKSSRLNSGYKYTINVQLDIYYKLGWLKSRLNQLSVQLNYTTFCTAKKSFINLLNKVFAHNPQGLLLELLN